MGVLGFGSADGLRDGDSGLAGGAPKPLDVEMIDDTTNRWQTATPAAAPRPTCRARSASPRRTAPRPASGRCSRSSTRVSRTSRAAAAYRQRPDHLGGALDEVGLVTFPGLTGLRDRPRRLDAERARLRPERRPANVSYATSANYQIVPFSSDFRYSDAATSDPLATLNPNSNLVRLGLLARRRLPERRLPDPGRLDSTRSPAARAPATQQHEPRSRRRATHHAGARDHAPSTPEREHQDLGRASTRSVNSAAISGSGDDSTTPIGAPTRHERATRHHANERDRDPYGGDFLLATSPGPTSVRRRHICPVGRDHRLDARRSSGYPARHPGDLLEHRIKPRPRPTPSTSCDSRLRRRGDTDLTASRRRPPLLERHRRRHRHGSSGADGDELTPARPRIAWHRTTRPRTSLDIPRRGHVPRTTPR